MLVLAGGLKSYDLGQIEQALVDVLALLLAGA